MKSPECGEEVSDPSPTCSKCDAPPAKASVHAQRHKTHPITWVATAAIIPLLCWDAWQTYKEVGLKTSVDVKFGQAPRESGQAPRPIAENTQSQAAQFAAIREPRYRLKRQP
jgi:hypothetical protein